jgi:acyl carrier protein
VGSTSGGVNHTHDPLAQSDQDVRDVLRKLGIPVQADGQLSDLDSVVLLSLIDALEQKLQLSIPIDSLIIDNFRSVDAVVALLARLKTR